MSTFETGTSIDATVTRCIGLLRVQLSGTQSVYAGYGRIRTSTL